MSVRVERPRETSKSALNNGCFGMREERRGDLLLLLCGRRTDVQHVDLDLRLLGRSIAGWLRALPQSGQGDNDHTKEKTGNLGTPEF